MAKVLIDIPQEQYDLILKSDIGATSVFVSKECMMHSIKNGTPLPEHHGRLIDADALLKEHHIDTYTFPSLVVEGAPTIIPATKEGAE